MQRQWLIQHRRWVHPSASQPAGLTLLHCLPHSQSFSQWFPSNTVHLAGQLVKREEPTPSATPEEVDLINAIEAGACSYHSLLARASGDGDAGLWEGRAVCRSLVLEQAHIDCT
jgi:hypothetical protein